MIISLSGGQRFEVPVDASFVIEFQTSFLNTQLLSAIVSVPYFFNRITPGEFAAVASDTSVLLQIHPGMLQPGEYELNPKIIIGPDTHRMVRAVAMKALANYVTTLDPVSCYQIA